jgi:hypothetical protein
MSIKIDLRSINSLLVIYIVLSQLIKIKVSGKDINAQKLYKRAIFTTYEDKEQ